MLMMKNPLVSKCFLNMQKSAPHMMTNDQNDENTLLFKGLVNMPKSAPHLMTNDQNGEKNIGFQVFF